MRVALLQTMYDEHENVLNNIKRVTSVYKDAVCLVTHSFDKHTDTLDEIKQHSFYEALSNLAGTVERLQLAAHAVSRNYSNLFQRLYETSIPIDIVVALMGDTKITDPVSIERRYTEMLECGYKLYACQAKGQYFYSEDMFLTRHQTENVVDFMPQLFFVEGSFALTSKVFSSIPVVNAYTTEQCLGDAFLKHASLSDVGRLNKDATCWLDYRDGVLWQVLTNGAPGRS